MKPKNILDKRDFFFFTPFGIFVSSMMWALDKINLPAQVDRGFLQGLIFDHIPFGTIGSLFIVVAFLVLLSVAVKKYSIKGFLSNQSRHLSDRVSQLSSPAFFVILGFSIPVIFIYLTTGNHVYLAYFVTFIVFAFVIFLMAKLAKQASDSSEKIQEKLHPKLAVAACLILSVSLILFAATDMRPKKVEVVVVQ